MRSQMFYNIDVLEIFLKIHRKKPVPDSLDSSTDVFLKMFFKVLGTPFLQNISEWLRLISI